MGEKAEVLTKYFPPKLIKDIKSKIQKPEKTPVNSDTAKQHIGASHKTSETKDIKGQGGKCNVDENRAESVAEVSLVTKGCY